MIVDGERTFYRRVIELETDGEHGRLWLAAPLRPSFNLQPSTFN
jgi:hypothetical protein